MIGTQTHIDYAADGLPFELTRVDVLYNKALSLKKMNRLTEAIDIVEDARLTLQDKTMNRKVSPSIPKSYTLKNVGITLHFQHRLWLCSLHSIEYSHAL